MPVMATTHFLPIDEEKSGRQQEQVFFGAGFLLGETVRLISFNYSFEETGCKKHVGHTGNF